MAAAPKKEPAKANDAPAEAAATGGKKKMFLMIGLALLLVVISVGATVVVLKLMAPSANTEASHEEDKPTPLAPAIYLALAPDFTINFHIKGRQRYLQTEVTLMYRDPAVEELLNLHMPAIRNGLVMLFSSKNFDELQTVEGKNSLRDEALHEIQAILQKEFAAGESTEEGEEHQSPPEIEQVLFTKFVMQ